MGKRIGPFRRLAVIGLLAATGGCEVLETFRVRVDDDPSPSGGRYLTDSQSNAPRTNANHIALEFRLWPHDDAE
jgi:hypothetical protein